MRGCQLSSAVPIIWACSATAVKRTLRQQRISAHFHTSQLKISAITLGDRLGHPSPIGIPHQLGDFARCRYACQLLEGAVAREDDAIDRAEEPLHAARHELRITYDRRDALAAEVQALSRAGQLAAWPSMLVALDFADRDLILAQTALKDAAYVLSELTGSETDAQLRLDPRAECVPGTAPLPRHSNPDEGHVRMRRPRDIDAELKTLQERQKLLRARRIVQLGELVVATGADTLDAETLAGALIDVVSRAKDTGTQEGWQRVGASFFRRDKRGRGSGTIGTVRPAAGADGDHHGAAQNPSGDPAQ